MATKYQVENLLITKEDANGAIQANPTVIKLCVNKFDLKEAPRFDEKGCLLSDSKIKVKSGVDYSGGATIDMDANTLPIILTHVLGDATAVVAATATAWVLSTVTAKGDIVNHSGGVYSLVAVKITGTGTTGATEPVVTSAGEKIVDGGVTWLVVPKLLSYTFEMKSTAPTFTVEYHLTDGTNHFYKQFSGVEISQLPLSVDGNTSVPELALDFNTASSIDSEDIDWVNDLLSITGAKSVVFSKDYYGGECSLTKVLIDDVLVGDYDSASMTIDKQLTSEDRLNCGKVSSRDLKVEGALTKDFTPADYTNFKDQSTFDLKFQFDTLVGSSCLVQFPLVEPTHADPDFETKDKVLVSPAITATSTDAVNIAAVTCVAPALISAGALIGTGEY